MRGALPLGLALALVATGGTAFLVLQTPPEGGAGAGPAAVPAAAQPPEPPAPEAVATIRPWQNTATLAEDLRDALAGPREALAAEWRRVSAALRPRANWTLLHLAPDEASPKVRALLVLAAGVHAPDSALLRGFLEDRAPVVRTAAVLASGYDGDGEASMDLLPGLPVPLGRAPDTETARVLRGLPAAEDAGVRAAAAKVLGATAR